MNSEFSRILTNMRQQKGVSQRIAAGELGISQALLSHYENGIREPGLDFLVRACDYYEVSSDYMLGRTLSQLSSSPSGHCKQRESMGGEDDQAKRSCHILCDSLCVLMRLLGDSDEDGITSDAIEYFELTIYKVFRHLYNAVGLNPESFFSVPVTTFLFGTDAAMKNAEQRLVTKLSGPSYRGLKTAPQGLEQISNDSLERDFPETYHSLLEALYDAGEKIKQQTINPMR